ncbi:MAG: hypothetical protein NC187_06690 [Candidatus Amulumruptor caecigallinarius]|nr:hypothetical protein [Candidatus Amulumruptor caecigallinarius]MCM1397156.1 hypothetical protein [Candidatus Amulumruptor caecigallinarius]MCM1453155.1 hypothetical protein [bacterium]
MTKTLTGIVVAVVSALAGTAATPTTLSGTWLSDPVELQARPAQAKTVVTIDFGADEASSGVCDFTAVYALRGCQMGSKTMKVNVPVKVSGKASWELIGSDLMLTFDPATLSAKADIDHLVLDVPEVMKAAMEARINEFAAGITGSLEDALREEIASNSFPMQNLDMPDDKPGTMTANSADTTGALALTFTRQ